MSDTEDKGKGKEKAKYPAFLGRLNMRFGKGSDYKLPHGTPSSKTDEQLTAILKNKNDEYIRSKYKGRRAAPADPEDDIEEEEDLAGLAGKAPAKVDNGKGKTSGIPLFGESDAEARVGWSVGHSIIAHQTTEELRKAAHSPKISAENSHALGHADYGTDHELSAPSASKAQNTEQLAIELAMRKAAKSLNSEAGLKDGTSLVHMKITDALDKETGQLRARRLKLIRRAHAGDKDGTVVFDHLMDGDRLHISRDEAYAVGKKAHDAIMAGNAAPRATARDDDGKGKFDRKGMDATVAPTRDDLHDHQKDVLTKLKQNQNIAEKAGLHKFKNQMDDRKGVTMVGPAFTEAKFPGSAKPKVGQDALNKVRDTVATAQSKSADEKATIAKQFETSGSLPADADSKMQKHMNVLMDEFGGHLSSGTEDIDVGEDDAINFKAGSNHDHRVKMEQAINDSELSPHELQMLKLRFDAVKASGNHSRLSVDEKKLLLGLHSVSADLPEHKILTARERKARLAGKFTSSSFPEEFDYDEDERKSASDDEEDDSFDDGKSAAVHMFSSHPDAQKPLSQKLSSHFSMSHFELDDDEEDEDRDRDRRPASSSSHRASMMHSDNLQGLGASSFADEDDYDEEDGDEFEDEEAPRVSVKSKHGARDAEYDDDDPHKPPADPEERERKKKRPADSVAKLKPKGVGNPKGLGSSKKKPPGK